MTDSRLAGVLAEALTDGTPSARLAATLAEVAVTITAGKSLDARWQVRGVAPGTVDARWAVRGSVADTVDTRWLVRALGGRTVDARWPVRAVAGDAVDTRWRVDVAVPLPDPRSWTSTTTSSTVTVT